MKKFKLILLFMSIINVSYSQNPIVTNAEIKKATVYLNQAQIETQMKLNLPAGHSQIIVENIANTVDVNSIQVSGTGDFTLMGVSYIANHLKSAPVKLEESLKKVTTQIEDLMVQAEVVELEKKMMIANFSVKGDTKNLTKTELNDMAATFRDNLTDIGTRELKLKREVDALEKEKERINKQIKEYNQSGLPLGKIELSVLANASTTAEIEIVYLARNAGWNPTYDLRVKDTNSDVQIVQKANIHQNTGLDWNNIQLSLSTTNPSTSATKPELYPQYLNQRPPAPSRVADYAPAEASGAMLKMSAAPMESAAERVNVLTTSLTVEFEIGVPVTVPSGGKPEVVEIQQLSSPATFKTYITPKLDKNAFLVAEITDWENFNLIAGNASIYFENKYVGKTYISEQNTDDILKLSLGKDTRIVAERKPIENYKSTRTFGSSIRADIGYRITLRNLKNETVNLVVQDQIPVSQDSKIEVSNLDLSGGELNNEDGKVIWNIKLGASENKELNLKYQVKYPKGTVLYNL